MKKVFLSIICLLCIASCSFNAQNKKQMPSAFLPKSFKNDTCYRNYVDFQFCVKNYEKLKDTVWANNAISLFKNTNLNCNKKNDLLFWRFYLYILMNDYQNGIDYFNLLEKTVFTTEYRKTYFVNTLQSILYNNKNDTVTRNALNKQIVIEIEKHLKTIYIDGMNINSSVNENLKNLLCKYYTIANTAVLNYYYVRARYEDIDLIINELNNANKNMSNAEKDFWQNNVLSEMILTLEKMKTKNDYHFEY